MKTEVQQALLKQMASAVEESGKHAPPTDMEVASQLCLPLFLENTSSAGRL